MIFMIYIYIYTIFYNYILIHLLSASISSVDTMSSVFGEGAPSYHLTLYRPSSKFHPEFSGSKTGGLDPIDDRHVAATYSEELLSRAVVNFHQVSLHTLTYRRLF